MRENENGARRSGGECGRLWSDSMTGMYVVPWLRLWKVGESNSLGTRTSSGALVGITRGPSSCFGLPQTCRGRSCFQDNQRPPHACGFEHVHGVDTNVVRFRACLLHNPATVSDWSRLDCLRFNRNFLKGPFNNTHRYSERSNKLAR